jgi:ABC-type multidrug transport system ATPase subunit
MLLIENVSKQFGITQAVKGVSFTVEIGESYGLLVPIGKSMNHLNIFNCML